MTSRNANLRAAARALLAAAGAVAAVRIGYHFRRTLLLLALAAASDLLLAADPQTRRHAPWLRGFRAAR